MHWLWIGIFLCINAIAQEPASPKAEKKNEAKAVVNEVITVTAEGTPVKVKDTPARVTVIDDTRIAREMVQNVADLVRYEPGVYVDQESSRLNLNGFNIRGIGANRVRTQIDGVRGAEQFDFGPISVHQYFLDVDLLKSVEILRGAASSLYGSDALGGQVSFQTKDPDDYLGLNRQQAFQVKSGYHSNNEGKFLSGTSAFRAGNYSFLGHVVIREHEAWDNQGTISSDDQTRTRPNPMDGGSNQVLVKAVRPFGDRAQLRIAAEYFESQTETQALTQQGFSNIFGVSTRISDSLADDTQDRLRLSLDHTWDPENLSLADHLSWQVHYQTNDTDQETSELQQTSVGPITQNIRRTGLVSFDMDSLGARILLRKAWDTARTSMQLRYGASFETSQFEQLRDRHDFDLDTGNPDAYEGSLIFPSRYFPTSDVRETGIFAEAEYLVWNDRLKLVPGLRYDRFTLSPDKNDTVFLESTESDTPPVGLDDDAVTGRFGAQMELTRHFSASAQFAMGFRAPPFNAVNSGFTNLAGGYQTLANPNLDPETSESQEFSLKSYGSRGSALITYFDNAYEDFIQDTVFVGVTQTGIALFQPQNVDRVSISGFEFEGDLRLTSSFWLRGAYADMDGKNSDTGEPLATVEPRKGVLGIAYHAPSRWGAQVHATFSAARKAGDTPALEDATPFLPGSYQVVDATVYWNISNQFTMNLGGFNLTDEIYWQGSQARGRAEDDPAINRYSSPGRSLSLDLQYRW